MTDHTVKAFTEKLEALAASVAQMGGLAEAQLADAVEAIARRDTGLAENAVGGDKQIDQLQISIEDQALKRTHTVASHNGKQLPGNGEDMACRL